MIPLSNLHNEFIDRPKLTEQQKKKFEYIVLSSLPTKVGVGTKTAKMVVDTFY